MAKIQYYTAFEDHDIVSKFPDIFLTLVFFLSSGNHVNITFFNKSGTAKIKIDKFELNFYF
jgi:hypothetical protein